MDIKSIMIGDWVKLDFYETPYAGEEDAVWRNGRIVGIHSGNWVDINFGDKVEHDIDVEDIEPIPLTCDILNKNFPDLTYGIAWCYNETESTEENHLFEIRTTFDFDVELKMNVKYIHELQHVLTMCGIDKPVLLYDDRMPIL